MKNTLKDIDFLIENGKDCWKHLNSKMPLNRTNSFCFGLIERIYFSALGLKPLVEQLNKVPQVEFSIGIILRTSLLDILIALNFHKILLNQDTNNENNLANAEQFANESLSDGLNFTMKYFMNAKSCGLLTEENLQKNYSDLANRFSPFFENYKDDGSKPILKFDNYHSPEKLFANVFQQKEMRELSKFMDLYQFYSKYDHFGIQYLDLIRQPISEKQKYIEDVIKGMTFHLFTMITALNLINKDDNYYHEKLKHISEYVSQRIIAKGYQKMNL